MKRQRGRGGRKSNGQANRHFESNGPDIKIRGSASHIHEKYQQLARDAASSGDQVKAEGYQQHAEHYFRVLQAMQPAERKPRNGQDGGERQQGNQGHQNQANQANGAANQAQPSGESASTDTAETTPNGAPDAMRVVNLDEAEGEQPSADGNGFDTSHAPAFLAGGSQMSAGDGDEAAAPKRQRRTRRPRKTSDAKPADDAQLALDQASGEQAAAAGGADEGVVAAAEAE